MAMLLQSVVILSCSLSSMLDVAAFRDNIGSTSDFAEDVNFTAKGMHAEMATTEVHLQASKAKPFPLLEAFNVFWDLSCPCRAAEILKDSKPADCCKRIDPGSINFKPGDRPACQPTAEHCSAYCEYRCNDVPHPNDEQSSWEYMKEKMSEIGDLTKADLLLAHASWQAQSIASGRSQTFIPVKSIHPLHPVGEWREKTWQKTQKRKQAVLAAKEVIIGRGSRLVQEDINQQESLAPVRSITPFIAVAFDFCGYKHVLLEGNGRLKGLQMAEEEDASLKDMSVEVTLLHFSPVDFRTMQEGIALLWNAYVQEADWMRTKLPPSDFGFVPEESEAQIQEYDKFRVAIVRCNGEGPTAKQLAKQQKQWARGEHNLLGGTLLTAESWGVNPCPIIDFQTGEEVSQVEQGQLFGASSRFVLASGTYLYRLCGHTNWAVKSTKPKVVTEFCPSCMVNWFGGDGV